MTIYICSTSLNAESRDPCSLSSFNSIQTRNGTAESIRILPFLKVVISPSGGGLKCLEIADRWII